MVNRRGIRSNFFVIFVLMFSCQLLSMQEQKEKDIVVTTNNNIINNNIKLENKKNEQEKKLIIEPNAVTFEQFEHGMIANKQEEIAPEKIAENMVREYSLDPLLDKQIKKIILNKFIKQLKKEKNKDTALWKSLYKSCVIKNKDLEKKGEEYKNIIQNQEVLKLLFSTMQNVLQSSREELQSDVKKKDKIIERNKIKLELSQRKDCFEKTTSAISIVGSFFTVIGMAVNTIILLYNTFK